MFCPICGREIASGEHRYCPHCGARLPEPAPGPHPPQPRPGGEAPALATAEPAWAASAATGRDPLRDIAGFWHRAGGSLVDTVFVYGILVVVSFVVGLAMALADPGVSDDAVTVAAYIVVVPLQFALLWTWNSIGWSPGKRVVGLRTVDAAGHPPGPGRGLGRSLAAYLSGFGIGLGYLWAAWDRDHQTWHDKLAGTYVIRAA